VFEEGMVGCVAKCGGSMDPGAILKGESLAALESSLQDARTNKDGEEEAITLEHVKSAIDGVTQEVFPHRTLDIQKLWMQRAMK
jgi:hypothetical protein